MSDSKKKFTNMYIDWYNNSIFCHSLSYLYMYFTLGLTMNIGLFFSKSDSFKKNIIINVVGETCFISRGAKKFSRQIWNDDRLGSKKLERAKLIYLYIYPPSLVTLFWVPKYYYFHHQYLIFIIYKSCYDLTQFWSDFNGTIIKSTFCQQLE